jgi:hypothetical protein
MTRAKKYRFPKKPDISNSADSSRPLSIAPCTADRQNSTICGVIPSSLFVLPVNLSFSIPVNRSYAGFTYTYCSCRFKRKIRSGELSTIVRSSYSLRRSVSSAFLRSVMSTVIIPIPRLPPGRGMAKCDEIQYRVS